MPFPCAPIHPPQHTLRTTPSPQSEICCPTGSDIWAETVVSLGVVSVVTGRLGGGRGGRWGP